MHVNQADNVAGAHKADLTIAKSIEERPSSLAIFRTR
jgi:hypothetical protein